MSKNAKLIHSHADNESFQNMFRGERDWDIPRLRYGLLELIHFFIAERALLELVLLLRFCLLQHLNLPGRPCRVNIFNLQLFIDLMHSAWPFLQGLLWTPRFLRNAMICLQFTIWIENWTTRFMELFLLLNR